MKNGMTRRDFIKGIAAGTVGVATMGVLGACTNNDGGTSKATSSSSGVMLPTTAGAETTTAAAGVSGNGIQWNKEADVVIVGGGGTGLSAALEASTAGASVLLLEKAGTAGGTTIRSGGVTQAANTAFQKENSPYQDDTAEKHFEYYKLAGEGLITDELVRDITNNAADHIEWQQNVLGLTFTNIYGASRIPYIEKDLMADRIHQPEGGAAAMIESMVKIAEEHGTVIEYETEVTKLIKDGSLGVIGVEAVQGGSTVKIKANKGVFLAASSIDNNMEMAKDLSPQQYWNLTSQTSLTVPTNTGDGIRMGMEIGAAVCGFGGTIDYNGKTAAGTSNAYPLFPCIIVNQQGKRFICEESTYAYVMRAIFQAERNFSGPTYMIFSEGSLSAETSPWTEESLATDINDGIVFTADSTESLAEMISLNSENLTKTLTDWNNAVESGADTAYGRSQGLEKLAGTLYAMQMTSYNLGAIGGLKINVDTQVLDTSGEVIPRLYCGGLNAGGWLGNYYPSSGTAIMGCIHWGRKAGKVIAALDPWT